MGFNEEIGLKLLGNSSVGYDVSLEICQRHLNSVGTVHGGVVCTVLDTAMARALIDSSLAEATAATLELKVNFLRPCHSGVIHATGYITHRTKRTAFLESVAYNENKDLIAKSTATFVIKSNP